MGDRIEENRFEQLLAEYEGPLRRLAGAYERDAELQKDLVQEIRVALWRALRGFRGQCSERTFVYRVAHNRALTHVARRHPEQLQLEEAPEIADAGPDPEQAAAKSEEHAELRARVERLPMTLRQVVMLALEGLSNAEIGEVLGIGEGNVAVRLTRARKLLKEGAR
jgi:RNA polymerase sigma-70 factor (ECF subfamily)